MSRYQPYPEYKESGIEWLGEIPKHWETFQLKRSVDGCTNGIWGNDPDGVHDLVVLRVADYNRDNFLISTSKLTRRSIPEKDRMARLLKKGDLLLEKSGGGENQLVGAVVSFNLDFPAVTSNFVAKMTPLKDFYPRFLTYAFAHLYSGRINYMSIKQNTGIQNLDSNQYLSEYFSFPVLTEQTSIANFLDRETAKIDTLIEKQQRLIELFKEKRQAVISHAVTKGLDPNVKMKDSGVEWLGEVPEGWVRSNIGFETIVKARLGWKGLKAEEYVQEGYIFLATPNIKNNEIDFENVNYITKERYDESPEIMLEEGDVLVTKDGSTTGTTNVVRKLPKPATVNSSIAVIRPKENLNSLFLYYFFVSTFIQETINLMRGGMGVPHLFQADLRKFDIIIPPQEEQIKIANYLDMQTAKIDTLIEKANQAIALFKERRTALISAAVTGKIDVRGEVV